MLLTAPTRVASDTGVTSRRRVQDSGGATTQITHQSHLVTSAKIVKGTAMTKIVTIQVSPYITWQGPEDEVPQFLSKEVTHPTSFSDYFYEPWGQSEYFYEARVHEFDHIMTEHSNKVEDFVKRVYEAGYSSGFRAGKKVGLPESADRDYEV